MKRWILAFMLLMPALCAASPSDLSVIRNKYKKWESEREDLNKTELKNASQPSADGTRAYAFRKSGRVLIVDESYFSESNQATWSFYYDGGKPFFILESESAYAHPAKVTENRYYLSKGKLIRWLEGKKPIPARGERFREQAKSVLELATSAYKNALTISDRSK